MVLESWYRFLIDPKPPLDVFTESQPTTERGPVDQEILSQRKAFLRPDSLVAIFMISDENDCSMRDDSYAWVIASRGSGFRMWRGSSVCDIDPNDPCCYSCMLDNRGVSADCLARDSTCRQSESEAKLPIEGDSLNLRCSQMKKRFGQDFLFPPSRYVNALTKHQLCPEQDYGDLDCDCAEAKKKGIACNPGTPVENPLFVNLDAASVPTGPLRASADSVFLVGIVGVPWQDLAVDPTGTAPLEYKTASMLDWYLFAPRVDEDYATASLGDPRMLESTQPRQAVPPITSGSPAAPESGRLANPINGHEWYTSDKDLQYACIFSLGVQLDPGTATASRNCDLAAECGIDDGSSAYAVCARRFDGCACRTEGGDAVDGPLLDPRASLSPLCQDPQGSYGNTQYFAKAYPGLRELQVLRGFHEATESDNAIVASICPKDLTPANGRSAGYGYNPAAQVLVDQLAYQLGATCLPRRLSVLADGTVPCHVVEAIPPLTKQMEPEWCNCTAHGRAEVSTDLAQDMRAYLQRAQHCGDAPLPSCNDFCFCRLNQLLAGAEAGDRCLTEANVEATSPAPGFCYVDPSQGQGTDAAAACVALERRRLRIVGNAQDADKYLSAPAPGRVYLACEPAPGPY